MEGAGQPWGTWQVRVNCGAAVAAAAAAAGYTAEVVVAVAVVVGTLHGVRSDGVRRSRYALDQVAADIAVVVPMKLA